VVKASVDLSEKVTKGCKGTILMIFPDIPFSYIVEFVDDSFETMDVLTVTANEIVEAH
jgi:voltage-gated potassium channel Kch